MKIIFAKKWIRVLVGLLVFFGLVQFVQPDINNPVVAADVVASDSVKMVLRSACYNCHSNEVRLSWFDKISPASWLVAHDINQGRKAINFSEWDKVPDDRKKGILFEALNHMQFGTMPLADYSFMHPGAKPGPNELNILKSYLSTLLVTPVADKSKSIAAERQFAAWKNGRTDTSQIKPSLNGFLFNPDYKNWVMISSTVRDDNGTLKIIMGNSIAVGAVENHQTNPWPNGTSFAKLTWVQNTGSNGNIQSGEFKQIAFMLKDAVKYRKTEGWGFSQWDNGLELTTHGKTIMFTTDCVNCHKPMKNYDYVFTLPLSLGNPVELEGNLITTSANSKAHTMSALYGNDEAVKFARSSGGSKYPAGAVLTLVTWKQKEDMHWFGAYIPGEIEMKEKVIFLSSSDLVKESYEKYTGNDLSKLEHTAADDSKERIAFITNQRAAVMP